MRILLIGLVLFALLAIVSADQNKSLSELFPQGDAEIAPPSFEEPLPAQPGSVANASQSAGLMNGTLTTLTLSVRDVETGAKITNAHIRLSLDDGSQEVTTMRFVGADGSMPLQLSPGRWSANLKLDIPATPGKDYYSSFQTSLSSNQNLTVFMQPVGSVSGEVIDADDNLVPNAGIKFECSGDYGETSQVVTDSYGSFSADWLPVGVCKISALSGKVGSASVDITKGAISSVQIRLERSVAGGNWLGLLVMPLIAAAIVIALIFYFKIKRRPNVTNIIDKKIEGITVDKRKSDLLSAMGEDERRAMEYLLSKGGMSYQNRIGPEIGLSKSSASRVVGALEARGLVTCEKLGRVKRITLSEWFLNGKRDS